MRQPIFLFMKLWPFCMLALLFLSCTRPCAPVYSEADMDPRIRSFNNVTLEMSLKPFRVNDKEYIDQVCADVFHQWLPLLRYADTVSVMLWTADGSEILNYQGDDNQRLEWAQYIGNPNTKHEVNSGPAELSLHERAYDYMESPPQFTYGDLKYMIKALKREGARVTGKPIRVGETFDPGPEFAKSEFKYVKHPEICMGNTMGTKTFVCCYAVLHEDKAHYAGYPDGIPEGTSFGTFFGRQSQAFLTDMGFDYIWFSNGFGFGMETWSSTGAVFDGKRFHPEKISETREKIVDFWTKFRAECPEIPIETRGTNISVGADLARDGVDLRAIYKGGFNLLPPPNSPWAAMDGNFGLELAGYMSRIAELPDSRYMFRYYTHDPWWLNSPWLDRYGREPHDIYLPLSVARIDAGGKVGLPTHLNFLSIDNSFGEIPGQVPQEVIPHILQARRTAPDRAGILTWVYPFDEYHDWVRENPESLPEIYYGDWFIQQAINDGLPLNTVVSTSHFTSLMKQESDVFRGSILISIVPDADSELETQFIEFVKHGGRLIVYGPLARASQTFLDFLNLKVAPPLSGELKVSLRMEADMSATPVSSILRHMPDMSGGGIESAVNRTNDTDTRVLAHVSQGNGQRDIAVLRNNKDWNGGQVIYLRGTNSAEFGGSRLPVPHRPGQWFNAASLLRGSLAEMNYVIRYKKPEADLKHPLNCISRHDNAFFFSGFTPNQTIEQQLLFPWGAPILMGTETELKKGHATYRLPKSYQKECRVFVVQDNGIVSCHEAHSGEYGIGRRIAIRGLKNATVRICPRSEDTRFKVYNNVGYPYKKPPLENKKVTDRDGIYYEFTNISGALIAAW